MKEPKAMRGERERERHTHTHTHKPFIDFRSIKYNNGTRFSNMNWEILDCGIQFLIDTLSKRISLSSWPPIGHTAYSGTTMLVEGAHSINSPFPPLVPIVGPYALPSTWFPPYVGPFLPSIPPWRLWHIIFVE